MARKASGWKKSPWQWESEGRMASFNRIVTPKGKALDAFLSFSYN